MFTIIVSIILSPLLAILLFTYMKYRFSGGYFGLLLRSYFWGIFSSIFAGLIFYIAYIMGYVELKNLRRILFYSFVVIGVGQEVGKFIILRYLMLPSKIFKTPSDGIIYSLMISFGALTVYTAATLLISPTFDATVLISHILVSIVYALKWSN